jgi:hypothetical protein
MSDDKRFDGAALREVSSEHHADNDTEVREKQTLAAFAIAVEDRVRGAAHKGYRSVDVSFLVSLPKAYLHREHEALLARAEAHLQSITSKGFVLTPLLTMQPDAEDASSERWNLTVRW